MALSFHLSGRRPGEFAGVWPDNSDAVAAFLVVASQWRTELNVVDGKLCMVWIGLDYASACAAHAARGMSVTPQAFAGLQVIEMAARDALNGEAAS